MKSSYCKPALTFEQQAEKLIKRGLRVDNVNFLIEKLSEVNYYRLSAYWYPFRDTGDRLKPGTSFQVVWDRYQFDRQLRLNLMDAVERIEISVRTKMVYELARKYGAFGHLERGNFKPGEETEEKFDDLLQRLRKTARHSQEVFVKHFKRTYQGFPDLPLWIVAEIMSFGNMFTLYNMLNRDEQQVIAQKYGMPAKVFTTWLETLNYIRNICAHHGRLWNRELAIKPQIPNKIEAFHTPVEIGNQRIFAVLTMAKYLLNIISPQSEWKERLVALFDKYPEVPKCDMGFPPEWEDCPIWRESSNGLRQEK